MPRTALYELSVARSARHRADAHGCPRGGRASGPGRPSSVAVGLASFMLGLLSV